MVVAVCRDVADAFADDAGVGNLEFDDEDILFMFGVRLRNVRGPGEEFAYGDDAQNHAYDLAVALTLDEHARRTSACGARLAATSAQLRSAALTAPRQVGGASRRRRRMRWARLNAPVLDWRAVACPRGARLNN